ERGPRLPAQTVGQHLRHRGHVRGRRGADGRRRGDQRGRDPGRALLESLEVNPMRKPLRTTVCALTAGALVLAGGACQKPKQAASADGPCAGQTLRITQATDGSMLYVADEIATAKGMFADQGLTIQRVALGGGSEAIQALVGGSADVTLSTHPTVLSTRAKGGPVVTFATVMDTLLYGITMKSDAAPSTQSEDAVVKALRGKKVGITSAGSSTDRIMRYLFLSNGLDPEKDVEIVATGGSSEMVASFARGSIDAYVISP